MLRAKQPGEGWREVDLERQGRLQGRQQPSGLLRIIQHRVYRYRPCPSGADRTGRLPGPRQEHIEPVALGATRDDALEHVLEVGERLDAVELRGCHQAGDDRPVPGSAIRPCEQAGAMTVLGGRPVRSHIEL